MPWIKTCPMTERREFISAWLREGNVAGLVRRFLVSRKTAYKWIARYRSEGPAGLADRSRRPESSPWETSEAVQEALCQLRRLHPTWGPKKLVAKLGESRPDLVLPAVSTAGDILSRSGLVSPRKGRHPHPPTGGATPRGDRPNAIWAIDYKGEFKLGDGRYCYPLTMSDEFSRYLLICEGFPAISGASARASCTRIFRRHGLPDVIRSDNGSPFASTGLARLSQLSVWWMRLGIRLQRITPGHPEQNGRHERIHRDLKAETTRPPGQEMTAQQKRFDAFLAEHNQERPHEALGQRPPARVYHDSERPFPERLPPVEYPSHFEVRKVGSNGCIKLWDQTIFLSKALSDQHVGLVEREEDLWTVSFSACPVCIIDRRTGTVQAPEPLPEQLPPEPTLDEVSP